ncbi:MAG: response regulator [Myxococcaceae bacterium]|nr:response regulator [Myxococcaceae bacterium]
MEPKDGPVKLLIVEDDVEIAEAMIELLRFQGHVVEHARDGREALNLLRSDPELPDAIVLDLRMPNMDGWSFRAEQRRDPMLSGIPVLAISADGSPQAEAIDAAGFLRKPIEMPTLSAELRRIIGEARARQERDYEAHRERLAALGRLAAGMAHEINNPLAWITANLRMLQERIAELGAAARGTLKVSGQSADEYLAETAALVTESLEGAGRIREIVQQVRSFSRPQPSERRPVSLPAVLDTAVKLLELPSKHRVRIERSGTGPAEVSGDETQLGQLFLNLLMNAADAVAESRGANGVISLRLSREQQRAVVEVEDNGPGIPEAARSLIFEPFFTTKRAGHGTGLGLFVCHNIVEAMGGELTVDSELGRGTRVRVALPLRQDARPPAREETPSTPVQAVRRRLLLVEDESILLRALQRLLSKSFDVVAAQSVDQAVSVLEADRNFHAVLCDIHMPGRGGPDLLAEVQKRWPALAPRLLFMSGGAVSEASQRFIDEMADRVLPKPLELERVEKAVDSL